MYLTWELNEEKCLHAPGKELEKLCIRKGFMCSIAVKVQLTITGNQIKVATNLFSDISLA